MAQRILYTGDTHPVSITIQTDSEAVAVPTDATVTAGLVSVTSGALLAGPWTVTEVLGGNWSNGVLMFMVDGDDTADLSPDTCRIEVQIETDTETLTRQSIETIVLRTGAL